MTNVLLAGFTSHWLRRESSHENRREKTHKRYAVVRSVPSLWSGKREQILLDNKRGWKSTKNPAKVKCFLLTSPLIELFGQFDMLLPSAPAAYPRIYDERS
jgi:hypothetical protein